MSRLTKISAEYLSEISQASTRFGDHEDVSESRVVNWMVQFDDEDLPLAANILEATRYYAASNIRSMTRELCRMVLDEYADTPRSEIAFVSVGEPGSSSEIIHRVLRNVSDARQCAKVRMTDLVDFDEGELSIVVLLDDFSGTGDQMTDWWNNIETLIRPLNATIVVALLVLNERAEDAIEAFTDEYLYVDYLGEEANVLASENGPFSANERSLLEGYCERTNCSNSFRKGYGECGLLLVFKHGCPNNSLPILWWNGDDWTALFKRSAI